VEKITGD
jgi:hypothetical protein